MKRSKKRTAKITKRKSVADLISPFKADVFQSDTLAKDFLKAPKTFARKIGISLESLECPPAVHDAMKRGEAFSKEVKKSKLRLSEESTKQLREIARKHFGSKFEVSFIPFGLQFREPMTLDPRLDWTATGTASVTWLDSDADVDG